LLRVYPALRVLLGGRVVSLFPGATPDCGAGIRIADTILMK
jgi:hypothetical protein